MTRQPARENTPTTPAAPVTQTSSGAAASGAAGPRSRPGGRTARVRRQVLDATLRLIAERGTEQLHYEEIARTAGVNRTTVHRNWPDRDDLVRDALAGYAEEAIVLPDTDDLAADLAEFLHAVAATGRTPLGRALSRSLLADESSVIRRVGLQVLDARLPALQARIDRAVRQGDLPPVDAAFLNELLTGPVHLHVTRRREPFTHRDARRVVGIVLAGLRAQAVTAQAG